jgi:hypothetical protein
MRSRASAPAPEPVQCIVCCNYGDGARVAAENTRQTIERLQQIIGEQQAQIDGLLEKLAAYEAVKPVKRAAPAIR